MSKALHIVVRGKQKQEIDPNLFIQVLLLIAREMDNEQKTLSPSPDALQAAIEDSGAAS